MHHWPNRRFANSGINPASRRTDWRWKTGAAGPISSLLRKTLVVVSCCLLVYFCLVELYLSSSVTLFASPVTCQIPQCAPVRHSNLVSNSTRWHEEARRKKAGGPEEQNVEGECLSFSHSVSLLRDAWTSSPPFALHVDGFETSRKFIIEKKPCRRGCTWPLYHSQVRK